ncbi:MAG TPA: hypothetical protein PK760_11620 [Flavobacteriales bacterium]|nr:hypothetical protein [Flavobacteriales bacterium]
MNRTPVLVFRTSVRSVDDVARLTPVLERVLSPSERWSFDLDDRDRVLRIESTGTTCDDVTSAMRMHGYGCVELE